MTTRRTVQLFSAIDGDRLSTTHRSLDAAIRYLKADGGFTLTPEQEQALRQGKRIAFHEEGARPHRWRSRAHPWTSEDAPMEFWIRRPR